jgi:hypothetical protein
MQYYNPSEIPDVLPRGWGVEEICYLPRLHEYKSGEDERRATKALATFVARLSSFVLVFPLLRDEGLPVANRRYLVAIELLPPLLVGQPVTGRLCELILAVDPSASKHKLAI